MAGTGQHVPDSDRRGPDFDHPTPTQEHLAQRWKALPGVIPESIVQTPASSANYTFTRLGYGIIGVIIHTTVGSELSAVQAFQSPARQASAQYVIACDGSHIDQCVSEADIAWHCGRYYPDAANPLANVNTDGIEHCDNGNYNSPRPDGLYVTSSDLVREICQKNRNVHCPICNTNHPSGIPIDRSHIRKHREVSQLATSCPDSLDIDRIVALAAGAPAPTPSTGEDDMLYVGSIHALTGSFKMFVAGFSYPDPVANSAVAIPLAKDTTVSVDAYCYSSSPVQSSDLGGGVPGPDYLYWRSSSRWVPDADLDTTTMPTAPKPGIPAGESLALYPPASSGGGVTMPQVNSAIAAAPPNQQTKDYTDSHIITALSKFQPPSAPHHHSVLGIVSTGPVIPD